VFDKFDNPSPDEDAAIMPSQLSSDVLALLLWYLFIGFFLRFCLLRRRKSDGADF
jgi:hypothetical protein